MGDREGKRADKYLHLVTPPEPFVGPQKDESEIKAKIGEDAADGTVTDVGIAFSTCCGDTFVAALCPTMSSLDAAIYPTMYDNQSPRVPASWKDKFRSNPIQLFASHCITWL